MPSTNLQDISGFGLSVTLLSIPTFAAGITLTQFADDADPFDVPAIDIADAAMGLNGTLEVWSKAVPLSVTLNMIPGSDDDVALGILLQANRVGAGKSSTKDIVTLTGTYPDGTYILFSQGVLISGMPGNSISSAGRKKSKAYVFKFQNVIWTF